MNDTKGEQEIDVLYDFLNAHLNTKINVSLGHYDYEDDAAVVINGTLLIFNDKFLEMKDENGKNMVISLKHIHFISAGWSDDILSVDKEEKV